MRLAMILPPVALALILAAPVLAQDSDKNGGVEQPVEEAVLDPDTDYGEPWPTTDEVKAWFLAAYGQRCDWVIQNMDWDAYQPNHWEIGFRYSSDDADYPERRLTLYQFDCIQGAYNFGEVFIVVREYDGIQVLQFPQPEMDYTYDMDSAGLEITSQKLVGYIATDVLINSEYDPETRTISSFSKWRGLGDAFSGGVWQLVEDRFVLKQFEIDSTYDDQMNPVEVVDWRAN